MQADLPLSTATTFDELKARMQRLGASYAASLLAQDMASMILGLGQVLPKVPQVRQVPLGDRDGAYDPEHHLILIDSEASPQRQRFTLAHEISHALLLQNDDLLSDLHDLYDGDELEQALESLCNVGAAAILMPPTLVGEVLHRFGPTGRALSELSRRADVSASAALYTLAAATKRPVLYAVCSTSKAGVETAVNLQVRASSPSVTFPYNLSVGTPIPNGHPIQTASDSGLYIEGMSYVPFRSGRRMPAYVTAYPAKSIIMAAFALSAAQLEKLKTNDSPA